MATNNKNASKLWVAYRWNDALCSKRIYIANLVTTPSANYARDLSNLQMEFDIGAKPLNTHVCSICRYLAVDWFGKCAAIQIGEAFDNKIEFGG